jgi:molybdopterin-binding protein
VARITDASYRRMGLHLGEEVRLIFKAEAVRVY